MKAIITGASSGLGREMARVLSEQGYDILAVARRRDKLEELRSELKTEVEILCMDVTDTEACYRLAELAAEADVFINNAGFGVFGKFCETSLEDELKMLDTNVRSVHILTKLVAQKFREKDSGYILNVASLAAFFPGPLFGAYYASKSYVLRLSQALAEELRQTKSKVKIGVLCPGPVHTEFSQVAKVNFGTGSEKSKGIVLNSKEVAEYAIRQLFKGKQVIVPGALVRLVIALRHVLSDKLLAKAVYLIQSKKCVIK